MDEVLELHHLALSHGGGAEGLRDLASLESAVAQPYMTFGGQDLYPTVADKSAALAFSLIMNHPFVDGNQGVGHAAMETFQVLNGYEMRADVDEQEQVILRLAAGELGRAEFTEWVREHLIQKSSG